MKKLFSTLILAAVLALGTFQTFAGIVVGTVVEQPAQCENLRTGIVVGTLDSILMGNLTGILMSDLAITNSCENQETGIVVGT